MASELARAQPLLAPRICCLDLDTFFVSVERLLDPTLEGKPVIVGGKPGSRGVVTAASYEVRRLGVKAGMSLFEAGKRAPDAIYLPTRHEVYGAYAERVREIARRFAPTVLVAAGFPALAGLVLVGTTHPRELDLTALRVPVAKVYGTADGIAPSEDVLAGARRLPPGTAWIELPGANHAQFGHYGPQFLDGEATMTREEQQARTRAVLLERLGGASRAGR
jgi:pimeloyl-ACP methyl ester carboxylesterase